MANIFKNVTKTKWNERQYLLLYLRKISWKYWMSFASGMNSTTGTWWFKYLSKPLDRWGEFRRVVCVFSKYCDSSWILGYVSTLITSIPLNEYYSKLNLERNNCIVSLLLTILFKLPLFHSGRNLSKIRVIDTYKCNVYKVQLKHFIRIILVEACLMN